MPLHSRRFAFVAVVSALCFTAVSRGATTTLVEPSALQKFLPVIDGWTVSVLRSDQVVLSPEATYTFTSASVTKDDMRVRLQISDTGGASDALTALAMIVVSMPADFREEVDGSLIKRSQIAGAPAAEMWNAGKGSGEITAIVAGRFVVAVDSSKVDSLETLRSVFEKVDFKALAALK